MSNFSELSYDEYIHTFSNMNILCAKCRNIKIGANLDKFVAVFSEKFGVSDARSIFKLFQTSGRSLCNCQSFLDSHIGQAAVAGHPDPECVKCNCGGVAFVHIERIACQTDKSMDEVIDKINEYNLNCTCVINQFALENIQNVFKQMQARVRYIELCSKNNKNSVKSDSKSVKSDNKSVKSSDDKIKIFVHEHQNYATYKWVEREVLKSSINQDTLEKYSKQSNKKSIFKFYSNYFIRDSVEGRSTKNGFYYLDANPDAKNKYIQYASNKDGKFKISPQDQSRIDNHEILSLSCYEAYLKSSHFGKNNIVEDNDNIIIEEDDNNNNNNNNKSSSSNHKKHSNHNNTKLLCDNSGGSSPAMYNNGMGMNVGLFGNLPISGEIVKASQTVDIKSANGNVMRVTQVIENVTEKYQPVTFDYPVINTDV